MESARVLRDGVERTAQGTERSTVDAVTVAGGVDVWPGLVDC